MTRLKDGLFQQLVHDPIAATGQTAAALKQKIGMVRRSLLDAIEHKASLGELRARHQTLRFQIARIEMHSGIKLHTKRLS